MAIGLLFSGQGAQVVGMGRSLSENSLLVRDLYEQADEILGWSLSGLSFDGPDEALTETRVCQPALFVHGYASFRLLEESEGPLDVVGAAGLSLGELTALAAAGVFDFATGLKLVAARGRLMQEACDRTAGGMASFIGGSQEAVEEICREFDIDMANLNCPGQIVVSGDFARVEAAAAEGRSRGFKMAKMLKVAGAYHSRLMASAREGFAAVMEAVEIREPRFPVYANVTGRAGASPEEIRRLLIDQVVSPVRFEDDLRNLATEQGVTCFAECGVGGVIAGMCRRIDRSWEVRPLSEWSDFKTE